VQVSQNIHDSFNFLYSPKFF